MPISNERLPEHESQLACVRSTLVEVSLIRCTKIDNKRVSVVNKCVCVCLCVCVCVYIFIYTYIYIYIYILTYIHTYILACMNSHTRTCTHIHTYTRQYVHAYVHTLQVTVCLYY